MFFRRHSNLSLNPFIDWGRPGFASSKAFDTGAMMAGCPLREQRASSVEKRRQL
jgi:hypothetical protein